MWIKVNRCNGCIEITIGDGACLSARRGAAVEHARAASYERGDELRSFVLNDTEARAERRRLRDVATPNLSRGSEESASSQFDPFGAKPLFCFGMTETDRSHRDRLIVPANLYCSFEAISLSPAFDEPHRMCAAGGECLGGITVNRRRSSRAGRGRELAEDGIDEGSGGTFASTLDQFHALIDGSTGRNAVEPTELIRSESKSCENFDI